MSGKISGGERTRKVAMKTVVAAPNAFKGSLSAQEVCEAIEQAAKSVAPRRLRVVMRPMADGGDGTAEVLKPALQGQWKRVRVTGPLGEPVEASYLWSAKQRLAVIEMARASGLALVPEPKRNPLHTTTFGTGELIAAALREGAERIIVGVGGSATTDGGAGALQALGVEFLDREGNVLPSPMTGEMLERVAAVDASAVEEIFADTPLQVACDVTNPLLGPHGAARVFGPQKGASAEDVKRLEAGLSNLMRVAGRELGFTPSKIAAAHAAGAAGGLAGGLAVFCGAELVPGAALVASLTGLEKEILRADLVITGEGAIDEQTIMGKAPAHVAHLAAKHAKPVVLVGGSVSIGWKKLSEAGINSAFSIVSGPVSTEQAMKVARALLVERVASVLSLWMAQAG